MILGRRRFGGALALGLTLLALGLPRAAAALDMAAMAPAPGEMSLGNPKAPVTVVEYASVGCPHCAEWAGDVFPEFRRKYVDTGQVRFVLREMLTGNPALAAAGFLTARCAGPDHYFPVVEAVFARQEEIGRGGVDVLAEIAKDAGVTRPRFDACLQDKAALAALSERAAKDPAAHGVNSTPTFFVDGEILVGGVPLHDLETAIARARLRR